jgi:hypothetical protein
MFAQMRGAVRDRLERAHFMDVIGAENVFPSLAAGVDAYKQRFAAAPGGEPNAAPTPEPGTEPGANPNADGN